jgi:hypothetical protein
MGFEINSPADEQLLHVYTTARNKVRDTVAYGVYHHLKAALEAYDQLDVVVASLAQGPGNQPLLAAYHAGLMATIANETAALRAAAEDVIVNIEAIEALQPGTFGIQLPAPGEGA